MRKLKILWDFSASIKLHNITNSGLKVGTENEWIDGKFRSGARQRNEQRTEGGALFQSDLVLFVQPCVHQRSISTQPVHSVANV